MAFSTVLCVKKKALLLQCLFFVEWSMRGFRLTRDGVYLLIILYSFSQLHVMTSCVRSIQQHPARLTRHIYLICGAVFRAVCRLPFLYLVHSCARLEHCPFHFVLELVSLRLVHYIKVSVLESCVLLCLLLDCEFVRCCSLAFAFVSWFYWLTSCLVVRSKSFSRSRYLLLSLLDFVYLFFCSFASSSLFPWIFSKKYY
jgi:hypothetical protein